MKKIDRLGWAVGLSFISYGVRVGVRVNNPEAMRIVQAYFPPRWKISASPVVERLYSIILGGTGHRSGVRRFNLIYGDISRLARTVDQDEALEFFESDIALYVAEMARRRVFVHAGVVGWKGQAILLPGRSYSGKSTLIAELVRAGATYYSDDFAVLDGRGRVHPYPKPLQIRDEETARQKKYPVETFGGQAGTRPLPVGLIAVSKYQAGARWRPRLMSAGRGTLELLANTISARRQPETALATLQQVVSRAPVVKSLRGEATETTDLILRCLDNPKERA